MKISQLPPDVREKAIAYRESADQGIFYKTSDNLTNAFSWSSTSEGYHYWYKLDLKTYDLKHQLQQLSAQFPNDLEFGAEVGKLISNL